MKFVLAAFAAGIALGYFLRPKPRSSGPAIRLTLNHLEGGTMALRLPVVGAIARFTLSATDAAGNAAPIENVTVTLSDPTLGSAGQGSDGDIRVTPSGATGTATLQVSADARIGEGEAFLVATAEIEFVAGEATFLSLGNGVVEAIAA